ncbi:MAG: hypothetical protein NZL93_02265, partial [Chthoniobacterales bacterium]|nr:hypothetical protein [Chthoniobacterales bacterium]
CWEWSWNILMDIILQLEEFSGKKAELCYLPPHKNDVQHFVLDITKLQKAIHFSPNSKLNLEYLKNNMEFR